MSRRQAQPVPVYPILLTNLAAVQVVVVGGGQVAARKVAGLLAAQAQVTVVSPVLAPHLAERNAAGEFRWLPRGYQPGDLAVAWMAFAATDQRAVNAAVAQEAAARGILCNVVDAPEEGNFHVPAVYRHEEVVVAVGSSGTAPARAVQIRDRIARWLVGPAGKAMGDTEISPCPPPGNLLS